MSSFKLMPLVAKRGVGDRARRTLQSIRYALWLFALRAIYTLYLRHRSSLLPRRALLTDTRPFLAFSGSGLLLAYFHGVVTYIRDHFYVDRLCLSGISGGSTTVLGLAMGIDLYKILLLGLHQKQKLLTNGIYFNSFEDLLKDIDESYAAIGITDEDVSRLSDRQQCFLGVTQCFPPQHRSIPIPKTRRELVALILCSMGTPPFFRTPGTFEGKSCIDGGFSAMYSVPEGQNWNDVIKVTCFPWWVTMLPPAMGVADIQPTRFMPAEVVILYPWAHQCGLIKRGYNDTKCRHDFLVSRGLTPLPRAPLTEWSEWERLFEAIDENNLPPLNAVSRSTEIASETERRHDELLRTGSHSDLRDTLQGSRLRRFSQNAVGSRSDANVVNLGSALACGLRN